LHAGCTSFSADGGLDTVRSLAGDRLGPQALVQRVPGSPDAAQERLAELLAQPLTAAAAVEVALLNNGEFQARLAGLHLAEADLVRAGRRANPSPTIEAVEGDHLRIFVTNRLPEVTTVHWHGVQVPSGMGGVSGLTQPPIGGGKTWVYEFQLQRPGTFMHHPHADEMVQMAMGMMGPFIVHPRDTRPRLRLYPQRLTRIFHQ
jgi:FtsP/CotA-like multicopper oxidase with cupredoxin domain